MPSAAQKPPGPPWSWGQYWESPMRPKAGRRKTRRNRHAERCLFRRPGGLSRGDAAAICRRSLQKEDYGTGGLGPLPPGLRVKQRLSHRPGRHCRAAAAVQPVRILHGLRLGDRPDVHRSAPADEGGVDGRHCPALYVPGAVLRSPPAQGNLRADARPAERLVRPAHWLRRVLLRGLRHRGLCGRHVSAPGEKG